MQHDKDPDFGRAAFDDSDLPSAAGFVERRHTNSPPPNADQLRLVRAEEAMPDGNARLIVESSHQQLEQMCREAGVDFASAVSPCLPAPGFVEFPRDAASSAA